LQAANPNFSKDALEVFDIQRAMGRRRMVGAPGPDQLARQLKRWQSALAG
jgi:argininosuccinate lyase